MKEKSKIYIEQFSRLKSHLCNSQKALTMQKNHTKTLRFSIAIYLAPGSTGQQIKVEIEELFFCSQLDSFVCLQSAVWSVRNWLVLGGGTGSVRMTNLCTMLSLIFQMGKLGLLTWQLQHSKRTRGQAPVHKCF